MPTPETTPTAAHHDRLDKFVNILERFSIVALTLGPAIAAPFANPQTKAIIEAEAPVAQALAGAIAANLNQPPAQ